VAIRIEFLIDGGIRVEAPGVAPGLASARMLKGWMQVAADRHYPVVAEGDVNSSAAQSMLDDVRRDDVPVTVAPSEPTPWPNGWTSIQIAAASGLDEQVHDLIARGISMNAGRRDQSPYRLALQSGHVGAVAVLRDAGARIPPGSQPPAELPNAVVFRNYLPAFTRWFAIALTVGGLVLAVAIRHWAFLVVAAVGPAMILVGNAVIGRTRIAIDGPLLSVRHVARWQGPIDLRELAAVGLAVATSTRMASRWRFVQRTAGDRFGRLARDGFEPSLADELQQTPDLLVVTVYSGRGFLSPGFERHLAHYVVATPARLSTTAQSVLDGLGHAPPRV